MALLLLVSASHSGFAPATGSGASSGEFAGRLVSRPLAVARSDSAVWLAVWLFGCKHAPRDSLPDIIDAVALLALGSGLVAAWVVKGARIILAVLSVPAAFSGDGLGSGGRGSARMLKGARLAPAVLSIPALPPGSRLEPVPTGAQQSSFPRCSITSPPLDCGDERTFCWNCPSCLRGGRNRFPSPGPARPPPRDISADRDLTLRLSRNDWLLGGGASPPGGIHQDIRRSKCDVCVCVAWEGRPHGLTLLLLVPAPHGG